MHCWLSDRLLRSAFFDCVLLGLAPTIENGTFAIEHPASASGRFLGWPRHCDDTYLAYHTIWRGREFVYAWCTPDESPQRAYSRYAERAWYDDIVGHEQFEVEIDPAAPQVHRPLGNAVAGLQRARVHYFGSSEGHLGGLDEVPEIARLLPAVLRVFRVDLLRTAAAEPAYNLRGDLILACQQLAYDSLYERNGLSRRSYPGHLWLLQRAEALKRQFPRHLASMLADTDSSRKEEILQPAG